MLMKKTVYPRIHNRKLKYQLTLNGAVKNATSIPIICNDEGLGDPASFNSNPRHASFTEVDDANCYPESFVSRVFTEQWFSLAKGCYETDKISAVKLMLIGFAGAFKEQWDASDDLQSVSVMDVLELQKESTDKQVYPIYNGTKLDGDFYELGALQLGLTTNTNIEGISFSHELLRDARQYYTIGAKLNSIITYVKTIIIKKDHPVRIRTNFNPSASKAVQEYTYCGEIQTIFGAHKEDSLCNSADESGIPHVNVNRRDQFLEWHEYFDSTRT